MKTLFAALFTVVMAVSQAQAADVQSTPATSTSSGWYYLEAGWYLMAPADANHVAQATATNSAPRALPAGVVPAGAPVVAITAPTIRIQTSAVSEAVAYANNSGSVWDVPTGNNSGSGDLGSMR